MCENVSGRSSSLLADEARVLEVATWNPVHPTRHLTAGCYRHVCALVQLELLHELAHHHPFLRLEVRLVLEEVHDDLHGALCILKAWIRTKLRIEN